MIPLVFTYQPVGEARSRFQVAVRGGLSEVGYSRWSGGILGGLASVHFQTRVTPWFAFGHTAFSVVRYRSKVERTPISVGHALPTIFQVTDALAVLTSVGRKREVADAAEPPRDMINAQVFAQYNRIFGRVDFAVGGSRQWYLDGAPHAWLGLATGSVRF
jgi:hypothetical protein